MKNRLLFVAILIITLLLSIFIVSACSKQDNTPQYCTIKYLSTEGGKIQGEVLQIIEAGDDAMPVTAIPNEGYTFVGWSDGSLIPTREDLNISSNFTVTAQFEKIIFSVSYYSNGHGTISGKTGQQVEYGKDAEAVVAVPDDGYEFAYWSDGVKTAERHDKNVYTHFYVTANFEAKTFQLEYFASGHGHLEGDVNQSVKFREHSTTVVAVAEEGYRFVGWSDGVKSAERRDFYVNSDKSVTAYFELITLTLTYNYKLATENCSEESITLEYFTFQDSKLIVPLREHFTFGGWYLGEEKISDENGNFLIGKEIFESEQTVLSAKWTANETFTYKILLVYVTEFYGHVPLLDGTGTMLVQYNMPEIEHKICQAITMQLKNYLDDLLDGLVDFQVDEYFTTVPLGSDSLSHGTLYDGRAEYYLDIRKIPEVKDMLGDYGSVLLTYSFNDYEYRTNSSSGSASSKYAEVRLDTAVLDELMMNNDPIENLLDLNYWRWDASIDTYIHEFVHTVELNIGQDLFHKVTAAYHKKGIYGNHHEISKYYLNNCAELNGEYVGIPYEFWKGEMDLITKYEEVNESNRLKVHISHNICEIMIFLPSKRFVY